MQNRQFPVTIEKARNPNYDATFTMSASSPDRVQDTIDVACYESYVGKKIIALWQHKNDQPMGYWENLRVMAGKLIGDLKVSSTNLGLMIKQLIADDVPLGASIGFGGSGKPNKHGGIHFTEIELMECSVVSVPMHPRAVQVAKQFDLENMLEVSADNTPGNAQLVLKKEKILRKSSQAIIHAKRIIKE